MRAPVDHAVPAIDQLLVPQPHECLAHCARVCLAQRETGAAPVDGAADHLELLENRVARLARERPQPLYELIASDVGWCPGRCGVVTLYDVRGGGARAGR